MKMPQHIVAVGGLVRRENGDILLVKSPRRGWEFPGGQVEEGESLPQALVREIREESGIEAEPVDIVGIYSNTTKRKGWNGVEEIPTIVNVDFRCRYLSGELCLSDETIDFGWFSEEEARLLVSHPVYRHRFANMLETNGIVHCDAYSYSPEKGKELVIDEQYRFQEK